MPKKQTDNDFPVLNYADEETMTVKDIANHQKAGYRTVLNFLHDRKLKAHRNIAGKFLVLKRDYNDYFGRTELKHVLSGYLFDAFFDDLDPAYVPPVEVDIDTLTDEQILAAYVIPAEWTFASPQDAAEWIDMARLAGLDKSE